MAELTTQAPDVSAVGLDPNIGTRIPSQSEAINTLARGVGNLFAAREQQQENKDAISTAEFILEQVSAKRDAAIDVLSQRFEIDLTENDLTDLTAASRDASRLDQMRLQNPGKARDILHRTALLQQSIARNPRLAPEFLEIFGKTGGSVGDQLDSVIEDAEHRRKEYMSYVDERSRAMGIPPTVPFHQRASIVSNIDATNEEARLFLQEVSVLEGREKVDRVDLLRNWRRKVLPAALNNVTGTLNILLASAKQAGVPLHDFLDDDQKAQIIRRAQDEYNSMKARITASSNSVISSADLDITLAPLADIRDTLINVLNGTEEQSVLDNKIKKWMLFGQNKVLQQTPELAEWSALTEYLFENLPGELADNLLIQAQMKDDFGGYITSLFASAARGVGLSQMLRQSEKPPQSPADWRRAYQSAGELLGMLSEAEAGKIPDQAFANLAGAVFQEMLTNPDDPTLSAKMDALLPHLSGPGFRERLERNPQLFAPMRMGLERYVTDISARAAAEIQSMMGDTVQIRRGEVEGVDIPEFDPSQQITVRGVPLPMFPQSAAGVQMEKLVTIDILPNGSIMFTPKPGAPAEVQARVQTLNTLGDRIGKAARFIDNLNLTNNAMTPAEVGAYIATNGKLPPSTTPEEMTAQRVGAGVDPRQAELLRQNQIAMRAMSIQDPRERAQFLRDNGIELPAIVEQEFLNSPQTDAVAPLRDHARQNLNSGNAVRNPDGSVSTVRSGSVQDPRLNNGRPTLIPFVWDGRILSAEEAVERAVQSGQQWPSFNTNEEATAASKQLSADLESDVVDLTRIQF